MASDLETAALRFRAALIRRETTAADRMVRAYGEAWQRTRARLDALTAEVERLRAAGETVTDGMLQRRTRIRAFMRELEGELRTLARYASDEIRREQANAVGAAIDHSAQLTLDGLGPIATTQPERARVAASFTRIHTAAVDDLAGFLSDGSPLRDLLLAHGADAAAAMETELMTGLIRGLGPRNIAAGLQDGLGGNLARAMTIARTEVQRAYRESTGRTYEENAHLLEGWVWYSALDDRVCPACLAMHGTLHPLNTRLNGHPNCRCSMLPRLKSPAERGLNLPDRRPVIQTGPDWLAEQDADRQRRILGKKAHEHYAAGDVALTDFVGVKESPRWGSMRYSRSLRAVLGSAGD